MRQRQGSGGVGGGVVTGAVLALVVLAVELFRPTPLAVAAGSPWSLGSYGPTDLFATVDLRLLVALGASATASPLGWRAATGRSTTSAVAGRVATGVLVGPVLVAGVLVSVFLGRFLLLELTTAGFDPLSLALLGLLAIWVAVPTLFVGLIPTGVGAGLVLCGVVALDRVRGRLTGLGSDTDR